MYVVSTPTAAVKNLPSFPREKMDKRAIKIGSM